MAGRGRWFKQGFGQLTAQRFGQEGSRKVSEVLGEQVYGSSTVQNEANHALRIQSVR